MDSQNPLNTRNRDAKIEVMTHYFEHLEERAGFVHQLYETGHTEEALLLCTCYIEGIGSSLYWPDEASARHFVLTLELYGGEEILWHIHPKQLILALQERVPKLYGQIGSRIAKAVTGTEFVLRTSGEILETLANYLTADELEKLRHQLWRGTLAYLAYTNIRSQLVHRLSSSDAIVLGGTTLRGQLVPDIDFEFLYRCLYRVLAAAKAISLDSGKWFGHDFLSLADGT